MLLFSERDRSDFSFKRESESDFMFVDRCALPFVTNTRRLLERYVSKFPSGDRSELIARMRSGDDTHYRSAVFEVLLHEILLRLGCELRCHPELPNGSSSRPDFLVRTPSDEEFYLEAVLATEKWSHRASNKIKEAVLWQFYEHTHPYFMVSVRTSGLPATQPSAKKLLQQVKNWLDSLDPDLIARNIDLHGWDSAPSFDWSHEDWSLSFRPIPIVAERRGNGGPIMGMITGEGGWVNSRAPIREALNYKSSKYGRLDKALLVAVNVDAIALRRMDEMQALYGEEYLQTLVGEEHAQPTLARAPNGAWRGPSGPRGRRASGAWLFNSLNMYSLGEAKQTVYFHPCPNVELPSTLRSLPFAEVLHDQVNWSEGRSIAELLEIPSGWPHCEIPE